MIGMQWIALIGILFLLAHIVPIVEAVMLLYQTVVETIIPEQYREDEKGGK